MKALYPKQLEIAQAVAAMLSEVGIKVNIRNLEIATAREQRTAGNYDLFFSGWAHMPHDPDWYFGQWFTRAGAEKLTRFSDPRVEQLIAEGRVPIRRCASKSTRRSRRSSGRRSRRSGRTTASRSTRSATSCATSRRGATITCSSTRSVSPRAPRAVMRSYLLTRIWQSAVTLVGVSILVFVILRVVPG